MSAIVPRKIDLSDDRFEYDADGMFVRIDYPNSTSCDGLCFVFREGEWHEVPTEFAQSVVRRHQEHVARDPFNASRRAEVARSS